MVGKWKQIAPNQIPPRIPEHHIPRRTSLPHPPAPVIPGRGFLFSWVLLARPRRVVGDILALARANIRYVISLRPSAKHWRESRSTDPLTHTPEQVP